MSIWKTSNGFQMIYQYLWSKAGLGFDQCNHPHFVLWKRERKGNRRGREKVGGGTREGREIDQFESLELRRDRTPERCSPRPPSQGSLKQLLSTHQKLMASKNLQHYLLPDWIGTCNGRELFLRTEISGAGKRRRPTRQAADTQNWWNRHPDSPESKSCLALIHPGHSEACIIATCDFKYYYSFGH